MIGTGLRVAWLKLLRRAGIKSFVTSAGGRSPFVCHVGDFLGELPFYNLGFFKTELLAMSHWCADLAQPVIFDVGAHVGFVASQLAQALLQQNPLIYCFEPVPTTFARLQRTIQRLALDDWIVPLPLGVSDQSELLRIDYDPWESMLAQVMVFGAKKTSHRTIYSAGLSIDTVTASVNRSPCLIKVDVEGYEARVFRGANRILSADCRPGILFELNPSRLQELGSSVKEVSMCLPQYIFYYVGSWRDRTASQFGEPISNLQDLSSDCDIFAVPATDEGANRWSRVVSAVKQKIS